MIEILKRHGIEVTSASQTLGAAAASPEVASSLDIPPGAPVVRTEIVLVAGERPVNLSILHCRADRSYFTANLVGFGNGFGRHDGNGRGADRSSARADPAGLKSSSRPE